MSKEFKGFGEGWQDVEKKIEDSKEANLPDSDQEVYDRQGELYYKEKFMLEKSGWRESTDHPGLNIGDPQLESEALDYETRQPLPDGSKQTAVRVLNEPVAWGDKAWFVKDGVQPAPESGYEVRIRVAKGGKWIDGAE